MACSKNETINQIVERRVDKLFHEFFTECPVGRKSVSGCPALGNDKTSSHLSSNYANQFFTECPYGKRAATECPYGKELLENAHKDHRNSLHDHDRVPEYASEFFTECPYGKRIADKCPYGHEIAEKAHKNLARRHHHRHHHPHHDSDQHHDYEKFFTECPYGKKIANKCPYGHEILEKACRPSKSAGNSSSSSHPDYIDDFFLECPYGKKTAETCPYGHDLLERAGVEVPPLKKQNETNKENPKCPFASMASTESTCPVSSADSSKTGNKCPVGGILPQGEKCPMSPNYKRPFTPSVDFYETDTDFKYFVELPGVEKTKSGLKLDIKDRALILSGETKAPVDETQESSSKTRFTERTLGAFRRTIPLDINANTENIKAKLENGLLSITVPKGVPSVKKSIVID